MAAQKLTLPIAKAVDHKTSGADVEGYELQLIC